MPGEDIDEQKQRSTTSIFITKPQGQQVWRDADTNVLIHVFAYIDLDCGHLREEPAEVEVEEFELPPNLEVRTWEVGDRVLAYWSSSTRAEHKYNGTIKEKGQTEKGYFVKLDFGEGINADPHRLMSSCELGLSNGQGLVPCGLFPANRPDRFAMWWPEGINSTQDIR